MGVIKLENVGKRFTLTNRGDRRFFHSFPVNHKITSEYWALRDINMEVEKGRVIGIIGRNGAGKSTLLSILAGTSIPTVGAVKINGRVSSLLTLGVGFQDELTGRENIHLNSSILGIGRDEINREYTNIVDFSELDGFLDYPLQTYSQGMRMRLGFSIAIHSYFDILLIDEIFSVGDVFFQKKCFDKIDNFKKQNKTMVIATQDLNIIERLCDEVFLLENGEVVEKCLPHKAIARYLDLLEKNKLSETFQRRYCVSNWRVDRRLWDRKEGSKEAKITEVKMYNLYGRQKDIFKTGEGLKVKACFVVEREIDDPHFGVAIFREDGVYCYGPNTYLDGYKIGKLNRGEGYFSIEYKSLPLKPGKYRLSTAIWDKNELWAYDYHAGCYKFEIAGENNNAQLLDLEYRWESENGRPKFKIFNYREPDIFLNLSKKWQNKTLNADIEVASIELLDSSGIPKDIFSTGENVRINLRFKFLKNRRDYYLWAGLFRDDDVYCHGTSKKLDKDTTSLIYPKLPLLSGCYYLSLGIWLKDQKELLLYQHKAAIFRTSFLGQDHGTVYIEHSWYWRLP